MSDLVLRKPPINLDDVAFEWHPGNQPFSMMMNAVTFQVMGFEHYMHKAMRDAEKFIAAPAIRAGRCGLSGPRPGKYGANCISMQGSRPIMTTQGKDDEPPPG